MIKLVDKSILWVTALAVFILSAPAAVIAYEDDPIGPFYGRYVGYATDAATDVRAVRNAEVIISPISDGFNVQWTTTIHRASKPVIRKFSINFSPRGPKNIYGSEMKINTFGHRVPLDPLQGDPFVWAVVSGKTMTVHSLLIFKDGGYEMQSYERKRTKLGLDLRYSRIRNGAVQKVIKGKLLRK